MGDIESLNLYISKMTNNYNEKIKKERYKQIYTVYTFVQYLFHIFVIFTVYTVLSKPGNTNYPGSSLCK